MISKMNKIQKGEIKMAYQGPMLIKEPELRWPIVLLASTITAMIALVAAIMHYVHWTI